MYGHYVRTYGIVHIIPVHEVIILLVVTIFYTRYKITVHQHQRLRPSLPHCDYSVITTHHSPIEIDYIVIKYEKSIIVSHGWNVDRENGFVRTLIQQ